MTQLTKYISDNLSIEAAKATSDKLYSVSLSGRNADVDIGTEDVWETGGTFALPTSAGLVGFVSSSAADAAAGTGARTITVSGLNAAYVEVSETVTLNGVGSVNTVNSYFILNSVTVATAGSGGTNAGTITGTSAGGGTPVLCTVAIGKAAMRNAIYMVPTGYTAYITSFDAATQGTGSTGNDLELYTQPFGGVLNVVHTIPLQLGGTSAMRAMFTPYKKAAAKSLIKVKSTVAANNTEAHALVSMLLIKD